MAKPRSPSDPMGPVDIEMEGPSQYQNLVGLADMLGMPRPVQPGGGGRRQSMQGIRSPAELRKIVQARSPENQLRKWLGENMIYGGPEALIPGEDLIPAKMFGSFPAIEGMGPPMGVPKAAVTPEILELIRAFNDLQDFGGASPQPASPRRRRSQARNRGGTGGG